jgi:PHD/YefM family antitoxin component YafN of YafNO toxin-antitoxin module
MIRLSDIHSVTDFQRNPKAILGKLKATQSPAILTVNGHAEFVVQDAESYQVLLDKVQAAEDLEAIREGLSQSIARAGRSTTDFFRDFERNHDI